MLERHGAKAAARGTGKHRSSFRRYVSQLWDDGWDDARDRHVRRVDKRRSRRAAREAQRRQQGARQGALRRYIRGLQDDAWAACDRRWAGPSNAA